MMGLNELLYLASYVTAAENIAYIFLPFVTHSFENDHFHYKKPRQAYFAISVSYEWQQW